MSQQPPTAQPHRSDRLIRLLPVGRVGKWIGVVAWLVLIGATSGLAGRIWSITQEDAYSWLPRSAESTEVIRLQERFASGDRQPAIVVYHRDGGLTDTDRDRAAADAGTLAGRLGPTPTPEPEIAADGTTLMYALPLPADGAPGDHVTAIRDTVGRGTAGLDIRVTGPPAFQADLDQTYQGIDTTLLLVTVVIVALLLLVTYRSVVLWIVPLLVVAMANQLATAVTYVIARATDTTVNSAAIFVITVLVYGVGTDYALLITARYREELRRHEDRHTAMRMALAGAGPAILASAATVALGLICMLAADLNSTRSLGPAGAIGVVCAFLAMTTLFPAVLVALGRWVFWPYVPRFGEQRDPARSIWGRLGDRLARRPRPMWIGTTLVLGALALGILITDLGLPQDQAFRARPDSITGQELLARSFPAGAAQPTVVIADSAAIDQVAASSRGVPGVADVRPAGAADGLGRLLVTVDAAPGTPDERSTVQRLRDAVHAVPDADALVGGPGAQALDLGRTTERDERVVVPLILAVVLAVLVLLLRAVLGPILLVASVVLSFGAALGITALLSEHVFGFGGLDTSLPLSAFAFLVAVGVDYNIFLVSRIRQEAARTGSRTAVLTGLTTTGGVITSAGVVLAGTFAALGVLPATATVQLGLAVAIGVLLDTLLVRSVLVPALMLELGDRFWWPSRPAARPAPAPTAGEQATTSA